VLICPEFVTAQDNPSPQTTTTFSVSASEPTDEQLEGWVVDLGDADYSTRQFANIQLNLNMNRSIPIVIRSLESANGDQSDRLFQFLSSIAADPYTEYGELAYQAIVKIALLKTTSKAIRAQKILSVIVESQRESSLTRLRSLGVEIRDRTFQVISTKTEIKDALVIDSHFTGSASDIECLRWFNNIEFVRLEGPSISKEILKQISQLPHMKRLQLVHTDLTATDLEVLSDGPDLELLEVIYASFGNEAVEVLSNLPLWNKLYLFGTKVSMSGKRELEYKLDSVDVIVAKGGFLGVQCPPTSVIIDRVVNGGAADTAKLVRDDKILSINNIPVFVFDDLRRELANYGVGEEVSIEFERKSFIAPGEPLQKEIIQRQVILQARVETGQDR